jgi:5-methyltetrahydropteroyltriglutamate--homocysteine methyltransferase
MQTTVVSHYPKIPNQPRPARLRNAIARLDRGEIGEDELNQVADEVTLEVINEQTNAGIDIITDGQIRWEDEATYLARKLAGFSINGLIRYFDTNTYYRQPVVSGTVGWREPITVKDYEFAIAHSAKPVKAVLTGPYTLAALSRNEHYSSFNDLVLDIALALKQEAKALQDAGAPIIQLNEPFILKRQDDFPLFQKAIQIVFEDVMAEKALYTWFGSLDGLYPRILDLPVDTIGLDFVRGATNYDLLREAEFTKKLGLGAVDARNTRLESVEYIVERVRQAQDVVPLERLYLNPSCGLEYLPREVAEAKLRRLAEGAAHAKEVLG